MVRATVDIIEKLTGGEVIVLSGCIINGDDGEDPTKSCLKDYQLHPNLLATADICGQSTTDACQDSALSFTDSSKGGSERAEGGEEKCDGEVVTSLLRARLEKAEDRYERGGDAEHGGEVHRPSGKEPLLSPRRTNERERRTEARAGVLKQRRGLGC